MAAQVGLSAVAVTDHDSVDGLAEALDAGREFGVEVVPGVEVNIEHDGVPLDLLGYFLGGSPGEGLRSTLEELRHGRDMRNARILERLRDLGYPVDAAELDAIAGGGAVGRPHIAEALRRRGHVVSVAEAFDRFLQRGAPCWVNRSRLSVFEAVRLIRHVAGVAVIAHPGLIRTDAAGLARIVREARRCGAGGIECYHSSHDAATVARALALAKANGLVATGGSDFHGAAKPGVRLGQAAGGRPVPYSVLADLKRRWAAEHAAIRQRR
jgi:hypothetical protein